MKINSNYDIKYNKISFKSKLVPTETGQAIKRGLFYAKSVTIHTHEGPDDDTKRAALFMHDKLKAHGVKVSICIDKKELRDLGINPKKYKLKKGSKPAEVGLFLDHNGWDKVAEKYKKLVEKTKNRIIIDHHPETDKTLENNVSYIDVKAKSCCAILYRLAECIGEKITKKDAKNLLTGIISDFHKSKRIKFKTTPNGSEIERQEILNNDTNSTEVLDKVQSLLSEKQKTKIYNHIDIISNLKPKEQEFRKEIFSKIKLTPNGKMAYVIIDKKDPKWKALGMDNARTSAILRDLRLRLINNTQTDEIFTPEQKSMFANANIQGAITFYPADKKAGKPKAYQISMHSKSGTSMTKKWRIYAKQAYAQKEMQRANSVKYELIGDGHDDRSGGRIFTYDKNPIKNFIDSFLEAGQNVE